MDAARLEHICLRLPVFPLPRTVLLPGALLPLHVFEPRYRKLVGHCMATDRIMGIATVQEGHEDEVDPPLHPEVGIGEIAAHQPLPDGRSNIVLQYIGRVTLVRERASDEGFRRIEGLVGAEDPSGIESTVQGLKMLVMQLGGSFPDAAEEASRLVQLDGIELANDLARRILDDSAEQRAYLGADRFVDRVALVQDRLARFLLAAPTVGDA